MRRIGVVGMSCVVALVGGACGGGEALIDDHFTAAEWAEIQTLSPLPALPADPTNAVADSPAAAALGQRLFFDTRSSGALKVADDGQNGALGQVGDTGKIACASCHLPTSDWFDDTRSKPGDVSIGADYGKRNAPPVVNSAFYRWYGWAGNNDTMWNQAVNTTESGISHNGSRLRVAHVLHDFYQADYEAVFGAIDPRFDSADPNAADFPATGKPGDAAWDAMPAADQAIVNQMFANYGKALEAYDRLLVSRDAPFDRYVAGDTAAISESAKRGLALFIGPANCIACHKTPLFSDSDFHDLGVPQTGDHVPTEDLGRFTAVGKILADPFNAAGAYSDGPNGLVDGLVATEAMNGQFRTKHLRQIAFTGPYMHTGQYATLMDVVDFYNQGGGASGFAGTKDARILPLGLTSQDKDDLVTFLETLTGEPIPAALRADTSAP